MEIKRFIHRGVRFAVRLMLVIALYAMPAYGQQVAVEPETSAEEEQELNVIDRIMDEAEGNVEIIIDDELIEKILKTPEGRKRTVRKGGVAIKKGINKINGYRIQVFGDGRKQQSLEARARARGVAITAKFPKYRGQVYTFSSAPNWYTRVGNFRTMSEAQSAMSELRASFPQFANEMRIVKSQIVVIK